MNVVILNSSCPSDDHPNNPFTHAIALSIGLNNISINPPSPIRPFHKSVSAFLGSVNNVPTQSIAFDNMLNGADIRSLIIFVKSKSLNPDMSKPSFVPIHATPSFRRLRGNPIRLPTIFPNPSPIPSITLVSKLSPSLSLNPSKNPVTPSHRDIRIVIGRKSLPKTLPKPAKNLATLENPFRKLAEDFAAFIIGLIILLIFPTNLASVPVNLPNILKVPPFIIFPVPPFLTISSIASKNLTKGANIFASLPPVSVFRNFT